MFKHFLIITLLNSFFLFAQDTEILWTFDLKDNAFGNPSAADLDGDGFKEIVFSTYRNDGFVYALNSEDGSLLWKYNIGGCSDAAPLIYDFDNDNQLDVLVHSSCLPYMYCFNGKDGTLKWKVKSRGTDSPPSAVKIYKNANPYFFDGDFGGYLSCFSGIDGSVVWERLVEPGRLIQTAPVLADVNNDDTLDIVVATYRLDSLCSIYSYRSTDGSLIWKSDTQTNSIYHAPSIADIDEDGVLDVLVSDFLGYLYCFDATNGKLKWQYNVPGCKNSLSPTTIADLDNDGKYEVIYFCDQYLNVVDGNGKLKWNFKMVNGISAFRGGIAVDVNNDNMLDVVFGNYLGELSAVSGKDGSLIFLLNFFNIYGNTFDVSSGLLASDFNEDGNLDILVIGGWTHADYKENYGRAYMISTNSKGGPDWLMFRNNTLRNSVIEKKATSVIEEFASNHIVFPNPASDYIELNLNTINPLLKHGVEEGAGVIKIYNNLGENLMSVRNADQCSLQRIDISHLPVGLYFIQIGNYLEKIIKI